VRIPCKASTKEAGVAENVFLYIGMYDSKADAEADYAVVKELHSGGADSKRFEQEFEQTIESS
jgi:hypothetical protein